MSPTQERIYNFVVDYILAHQYPPSIREIGAGVGLKSTSSVHHHLQKMFETGILETDSGIDRKRAIRVPGLMITKTDWND